MGQNKSTECWKFIGSSSNVKCYIRKYSFQVVFLFFFFFLLFLSLLICNDLRGTFLREMANYCWTKWYINHNTIYNWSNKDQSSVLTRHFWDHGRICKDSPFRGNMKFSLFLGFMLTYEYLLHVYWIDDGVESLCEIC